MITAEDTVIKMTEGDFGVALPIEISVEQLTADDVFSIKIFKSINTENEASRILNISQGNISMCLCGKRNIAGGYHWQYVS
jgi:hypothetical protein